MTDCDYMQLAVAKAKEGIAAGQSPFGSAIVRDGKVLSAAHNTVWRDCDPTAHAEVNAIRGATRALKVVKLLGSTLYTTCEPCPMCLAAIHWAGIERVLYGASIADAADAGFGELLVSAAELCRLGGSNVKVEAGPLRDECKLLFKTWKERGAGKPY